MSSSWPHSCHSLNPYSIHVSLYLNSFPRSFLWNTVVCLHVPLSEQVSEAAPWACGNTWRVWLGLNSACPPADSHPSQSPSLIRVCFHVKSSRLLQWVQIQVSVCPWLLSMLSLHIRFWNHLLAAGFIHREFENRSLWVTGNISSKG